MKFQNFLSGDFAVYILKNLKCFERVLILLYLYVKIAERRKFFANFF